MNMNLIKPTGSDPATSSFTCNTCGLKFLTAELQRQHMKTEWHRYNLKRKVAQLPLVSSETFAEKVLALKESEQGQKQEDEYGYIIPDKKMSRVRTKGRRHFPKGSLANANEQKAGLIYRSASPDGVHLELLDLSGDESLSLASLDINETDSEIFSESTEFTDVVHTFSDSDDGENLEEDYSSSDRESAEPVDMVPIHHCFFCDINNKDIEANVQHMSSMHGFYIPERSFLVDLPGLLTYLSGIFTVERTCMVCGYQRDSLLGLRQHALTKGHCKIPYETKEQKLELSHFYDFSLSDNKKGPSPDKKLVAFSESPEIRERDVPGALQSSQEETQEVGYEKDSGENGARFIQDGYTTVHIDRTGVEMTLPTGARVGHRVMSRYYHQNLPLPVAIPDSRKSVMLLDRRLAPGITLPQLVKQDKAVKSAVQKATSKDLRQTNLKRANYKPHYRDPILGG